MSNTNYLDEYRFIIREDDEPLLDFDEEFLAEALEHLESGEWGQYGVLIQHRCAHCGHWEEVGSLWGCIANATEPGIYATPTDMPNAYLSDIAQDLLTHAREE